MTLEKDKEMEAHERQALEEQILAKTQEIQEIQLSVDEKEQETIRIQEEMQEAKLEMEVRVTILLREIILFQSIILLTPTIYHNIFKPAENNCSTSNGKRNSSKSSKATSCVCIRRPTEW